METIPTQIPSNMHDNYFKITPSLFTPERLDSFNSIDLYTSLIQASHKLEHGARLNNISWRIINKALLKHHSINKSKKRDGVKNIYYILNPNSDITRKEISTQNNIPGNSLSLNGSSQSSRKTTPQPQLQPQAPQDTQKLLRTSQEPSSTAALFQKYQLQQKQIRKEDPKNIVKGFDTTAIISTLPGRNKSDSPLNNLTSQSKKLPLPRQDSLFQAKTNESSSFFNNRQDNKMFFSSEDEYSDWNSISDEDNDDDDDFYNEDDEDTDRYNGGEDDDDQYYKSQWDKLMFTKNDNNIRSPSSMRYTGNNNSNNNSEPAKKSLLTGLFSNESRSSSFEIPSHNSIPKNNLPSNRNSIQTNFSISHSHTPIDKTNNLQSEKTIPITNNGVPTNSVTPPPLQTSGMNYAPPIEMIIKKSQPSNSTTNTQVHSRTSSFGSIVSSSLKGRYLHESNAPLTAQTILPTALSTHMFLPNIHQQRIAAAAAASISEAVALTTSTSSQTDPSINNGLRPRVSSRRTSMDIPSKNRNSGFLKTRMEISEEEKGGRGRSRQTKKT